HSGRSGTVDSILQGGFHELLAYRRHTRYSTLSSALGANRCGRRRGGSSARHKPSERTIEAFCKRTEQILCRRVRRNKRARRSLEQECRHCGAYGGRLTFKSYELEQVDVQIHGNVAVIRTTEKIESNTGSGRFRHLRVAVRRDGRWQLIATQMTRVADQ